MRFSFEVPGKPIPQGSMRSYGRGRMVHSNAQDLLPWRASIAAHAHNNKPVGWDNTGPMGLQVTFWMPRPKGHHGSKGLRPSAPWWPTTRPDLDKLVRAVADSLTDAMIWADDSQLVHLTAEKTYAGTPGLWCAIQHLTERTPTA